MKRLWFVLVVAMAFAAVGCSKSKAKMAVPECEAVLNAMESCGGKIGGAQGDGLKRQADTTRQAWAKQNPDKSTCDGVMKDLKRVYASKCDL